MATPISSPSSRPLAAQTASAPHSVNRGTAQAAVEPARPALTDAYIAQHADPKALAEARTLLQAGVFAEAGIHDLKAALQLSPAQCQDCFPGNAEKGMLLSALVQLVQVNLAPCQPGPDLVRKTPLEPLGVELAIAGIYTHPKQPAVRPDPLLLQFSNVVRGSELYMVNRSDLDDPKPIRLPTDTLHHAETDGDYSLILDDAWMNANGIRPGAVLEFYQEKGGRTSDSKVVALNPGGARTIPAPKLSGGEIFGDVVKDSHFEIARDQWPAGVRIDRLQSAFQGDQITLSAKLGRGGIASFTEPKAKIVLENLRTGKVSDPVTVADDGSFKVGVDARPSDPILARVVDHSGHFESSSQRDPMRERRIAFSAGGSDFVLARNPRLGIDGPPEVSLSRVGLDTRAGATELAGACALTPGSIITVVNQETGARSVAVADRQGSFRMPVDAKLGDYLDVRVRNPFVSEQPEGTLGARNEAFFSLHVEGSAKRAELVGVPGVNGGVVPEDRGAVKPASDVDPIGDGRPQAHATRPNVDIVQFDTRTENRGFNRRSIAGFHVGLAWAQGLVGEKPWIGGSTFDGRRDAGYVMQATSAVDTATRQITITLDATQRGGWLDESAPGQSSVFAPIDTGRLGAGAKGETFEILVKSPSGEVLSRSRALFDGQLRGLGSTTLKPSETQAPIGAPPKDVKVAEGVTVRVIEPFDKSFRDTHVAPLVRPQGDHSGRVSWVWSEAVVAQLGDVGQRLDRAAIEKLSKADGPVGVAAKALLKDAKIARQLGTDGQSLHLSQLDQAMSAGRTVKIHVGDRAEPGKQVSIYDYSRSSPYGGSGLYAIGLKEARVEQDGWLNVTGTWGPNMVLKLGGLGDEVQFDVPA